MNRRTFLALTASGLLVPEWLLDPPKGRSAEDKMWESVSRGSWVTYIPSRFFDGEGRFMDGGAA